MLWLAFPNIISYLLAPYLCFTTLSSVKLLVYGYAIWLFPSLGLKLLLQFY